MQFEIKTKIMKFGDIYAIPLEFDFCMRTGLKLGTGVKLTAHELGQFEMKIDHEAGGVCSICGQETGFNRCVACDRFVCNKCFDPLLGVCGNCKKRE